MLASLSASNKVRKGESGNIISIWRIKDGHEAALRVASRVKNIDAKIPAKNVVARARVYMCKSSGQEPGVVTI
ncbi:hypothetical protein [Vulcanisaeta moutnovskia]|uniref:hypothetical protein n=1 Tax=Vulcanisaeta moutnovskia TaxID=985052 RepID=UPI00064FC5A8|nr:hypothetical protein [Vulcanisaeta moutnovskia]